MLYLAPLISCKRAVELRWVDPREQLIIHTAVHSPSCGTGKGTAREKVSKLIGLDGDSSVSAAVWALFSHSHSAGVNRAVLSTPQHHTGSPRGCPLHLSQTRYTSIKYFLCSLPFQDQGLHSLLTLKLLPWCLFLLCGQLCSSWCSYSSD